MNLDQTAKIYQAIHTSPFPDLADDLVQSAVRYARLRVDWQVADADNRREIDPSRTRAHDAFIASCNILSRNMAQAGEDIDWRDQIGEDRKTMGDFACHLHSLLGILAR